MYLQVIRPFLETLVDLSSLKYVSTYLPYITMSQKPCQQEAVWLPGDMYILSKGPGGDKQATDKSRTTESYGMATVSKMPLLAYRNPSSNWGSLIISAAFYFFPYKCS